MVKIKKSEHEIKVTNNAYETYFKSLGYEIINNKKNIIDNKETSKNIIDNKEISNKKKK